MDLNKRDRIILTAKLLKGRRTKKLSFNMLATCYRNLVIYLPRVTAGSLSLRINLVIPCIISSGGRWGGGGRCVCWPWEQKRKNGIRSKCNGITMSNSTGHSHWRNWAWPCGWLTSFEQVSIALISRDTGGNIPHLGNRDEFGSTVQQAAVLSGTYSEPSLSSFWRCSRSCFPDILLKKWSSVYSAWYCHAKQPIYQYRTPDTF